MTGDLGLNRLNPVEPLRDLSGPAHLAGLNRMLAPCSIVGASLNDSRISRRPIYHLKSAGFDGVIYPVDLMADWGQN
jgi:hypothetical protein